MQTEIQGTTLRESIEAVDELVGELLWAFISSTEDLELAAQAARRGRLSGIWLLPTEMRSVGQAVTLVNWLQGVSPRPLLVGVDAEAGMGLVMGGTTQLPTAMAIGATGDPQLAREAGRVTAEEAGACGINAVAAPVLDVNINPRNPIINTRAFGGDPGLVSSMGLAFMEGMHSGSLHRRTVLPIGKHFPGHGDTIQDSHLQLEAVAHTRERMEEIELAPFRAAIAEHIPMLMTAHVAYPAIEQDAVLPATLSKRVQTDLLRSEMGFDGALVTDCMNMHAVAHNFEVGDAAIQSALAGCDLLLTHQWEFTHETLVRAIFDGRLSEARLREAADRVRTVKKLIFGADLAIPPAIDADAATAAVSTRDHLRVAERIAAGSITLLDGHLTPPSGHPLIIATRMARRFDAPVEAQLHAELTQMGWDDAEVLMVDPFPDEAQVTKAKERAEQAGWTALLHFNRVQSFDPDAVQISDSLLALSDALADACSTLTVVSMGTPYILPLFTRTSARLCSYSTCDASVFATLQVLRGNARPLGRLPVKLS